MHLASVRHESHELPAVVLGERGVALVRDLLPGFEGDLLDVLRREAVPDLRAAAEAASARDLRVYQDTDMSHATGKVGVSAPGDGR